MGKKNGSDDRQNWRQFHEKKDKNAYIERSFDYVARETMRITDRYQLQDKFNIEARGTGALNAKKKRMRKFRESEGLGPLNQDNKSKSKSKLKNKNGFNPQGNQNILNNFRRRDDRPGRLQKDIEVQKKINQVSTFGKEVAKIENEKSQFKPLEGIRSTAADSRAKSSCSFDDIEFNLQSYKTQKTNAQKEAQER